jgi:hypothetical protein
MFKGYMTKFGGALVGVGLFLSQLPQDVAVGTYNGAAVTIGHLTMAVGAFCTIFGFRRAMEK